MPKYKLKIDSLDGEDKKSLYFNPGYVMLHAAFQCLMDYMEHTTDGVMFQNSAFSRRCIALKEWWILFTEAQEKGSSEEKRDYEEEATGKLLELASIWEGMWF